MHVAGSKPPMSNCITTHKPLAENVRGLCVFAVGFVHAQAGVLISCYSLSPYKVIHTKTHMNDDRPPLPTKTKRDDYWTVQWCSGYSSSSWVTDISASSILCCMKRCMYSQSGEPSAATGSVRVVCSIAALFHLLSYENA